MSKEQRRSPRFHIAIPVEVAWTTQEGFHVTVLANTQVVSAHGALMTLKSLLPIPNQVELVRPGQSERAAAHVIYIGNRIPGVETPLSVEFADPSVTFWGI